MTDIECFVCDATFESKTSHLKFIGKFPVLASLEDGAFPDSQLPSVETESPSTDLKPEVSPDS